MTNDIVQTDAPSSEDSAPADTPTLEQMVDQGQDAGPETSDTPDNITGDDSGSLTDDTQQQQTITEEPVEPELAAIPETPVQEQPQTHDLPPELLQALNDPRGRERLLNLDKLYGQQSNELGQLRRQVQQYQELGDPNEIRNVLQRHMEQAQISNLQPWNRGHPQHQRFQVTRERWRTDMKRLERVAPENREAVRQSFEEDYSPEDLQALKAHDAWRASEESLSPEDREDRLREITRQETLATIQTWEQSQVNRMHARALLDKHGDLLLKHEDDVNRIMNPATPRRDIALELIQARAELAALKGKSIKDSRQVATAQARDRLTKDQAGISRDAPRRSIDLKAAALKAAAEGDSPLEVMQDLFNEHQDPNRSD